jgi:hypothetical protein
MFFSFSTNATARTDRKVSSSTPLDTQPTTVTEYHFDAGVDRRWFVTH